MRAHAVLFQSATPERYARMADVLVASAAEWNLPLTVHEIANADEDVKQYARQSCKRTWIDNARKAKHHFRIIEQAKDGDVLCMIDADAMITGDLSDVEQMDFDLAYTVRPPGATWKINTGVYFVRITEQVRSFAYDWFQETLAMLMDQKRHDYWRKEKRYGGIHQAALGRGLEPICPAPSFKMLPLPCETYNCVPSVIEQAESPKVVHIMGRTREWCFGRTRPTTPNAKKWAEKWREYDARSSEAL